MDSSFDTKRRSVLAILGDIDHIGAVEVYRVTAPLTYLEKRKQYQCHWMPVQGVKQLLEKGDTSVFHHDLIILHKVLSNNVESGEKLIESLRTFGAKVIYETDDDYSGVYRPPDTTRPGNWDAYLQYVDAATVSTHHLGRFVGKQAGKPVHVCPNSIDVDWFTSVSVNTNNIFPDSISIMLCGTETHGADWRVMETVIPRVKKKHPNVQFITGGFCPDYLDDLTDYLPGVEYTEYPCMVRQADILLCPLEPRDGFNDSKSSIKALEGWAAARRTSWGTVGCAVIASKCKAYNGAVQNRSNGLLVSHTPEAWERAICKLVEDERLRFKLAKKGLQEVRDKHNISYNWRIWDRAYCSILEL